MTQNDNLNLLYGSLVFVIILDKVWQICVLLIDIFLFDTAAVSVPSAASGVVHSQAMPVQTRFGPVDVNIHKPRHFDLVELHIGSFKVNRCMFQSHVHKWQNIIL